MATGTFPIENTEQNLSQTAANTFQHNSVSAKLCIHYFEHFEKDFTMKSDVST